VRISADDIVLMLTKLCDQNLSQGTTNEETKQFVDELVKLFSVLCGYDLTKLKEEEHCAKNENCLYCYDKDDRELLHYLHT